MDPAEEILGSSEPLDFHRLFGCRVTIDRSDSDLPAVQFPMEYKLC